MGFKNDVAARIRIGKPRRRGPQVVACGLFTTSQLYALALVRRFGSWSIFLRRATPKRAFNALAAVENIGPQCMMRHPASSLFNIGSGVSPTTRRATFNRSRARHGLQARRRIIAVRDCHRKPSCVTFQVALPLCRLMVRLFTKISPR